MPINYLQSPDGACRSGCCETISCVVTMAAWLFRSFGLCWVGVLRPSKNDGLCSSLTNAMTSVPCERGFSCYNLTKTSIRNSLKVESVNKNMMLRWEDHYQTSPLSLRGCLTTGSQRRTGQFTFRKWKNWNKPVLVIITDEICFQYQLVKFQVTPSLTTVSILLFTTVTHIVYFLFIGFQPVLCLQSGIIWKLSILVTIDLLGQLGQETSIVDEFLVLCVCYYKLFNVAKWF